MIGFKRKPLEEIPLQELKAMDAQTVLKRYHLVIYSDEDIAQINKGLKLIREVLERNTKKFEEMRNNGKKT